MNFQHVKQLFYEWSIRTQFFFPMIAAASRDRGDENIIDHPDFGTKMAQLVVTSGVTFSELGKSPYGCIRKEIEYLEATGRRPTFGDAELRAVIKAHELNNNPTERIVMQAALLAKDATVELVATFFKLPPMMVAAFCDLFFNVVDRKDEPVYLCNAAETALAQSASSSCSRYINRLDEDLLHAGLNGVLRDILPLAGVRCTPVTRPRASRRR